MQFRLYQYDMVPSEVVTFLDHNLPHEEWSGSEQLVFYVLLGDGGTVNRYTEEMEGQTILAVAVMKYLSPCHWLTIVVHPEYRLMGFARRLLRRVVEDYGNVYANVLLTSQPALNLAMRYGMVDSVSNPMRLRFMFSRHTVPHARCGCSRCEQEMLPFRM